MSSEKGGGVTKNSGILCLMIATSDFSPDFPFSCWASEGEETTMIKAMAVYTAADNFFITLLPRIIMIIIGIAVGIRKVELISCFTTPNRKIQAYFPKCVS